MCTITLDIKGVYFISVRLLINKAYIDSYMKYNKGFSSLAVLLIVVGVLVVGGIAYFAGKSSVPKNEVADNSNYVPMTEQNSTPPVTNNNSPQQQTPPPADNQQQQTPPPTPACATSITVLSPNGGETYSNTSALKVTWKSCNIPANATLAVELLYGTDGIMTAFVPNTGSYTFQLSPTALMNPSVTPSQPVTYGKHFKVQVGTSPGTSPSYHDSSDNLFTIQ